MKRVVLVITVIILMTGVCGCDMKDLSVKDTTTGKMISYMEKKYDDEFTYIDVFGGGMGSDSKNILLRSGKYPEYDITVSRSEKNGEVSWSDNYTEYRFFDETAEYAGNLFREVFGDAIMVSYGVSSLGSENNFSADTTFEQFLRSDSTNFDVKVIVSDEYIISDKDELSEKAKDLMLSQGISFSANIYFPENPEEYVTFEDMSISQRLNMTKLYIYVLNDGTVSDCTWR